MSSGKQDIQELLFIFQAISKYFLHSFLIMQGVFGCKTCDYLIFHIKLA